MKKKVDIELSIPDNSGIYKSLFQFSNDGIVIVDKKSKLILDINKSALDLLGYKQEEIIHKPIFLLYPKEVLPFIKVKIQELAKNGNVDFKNMFLKFEDDTYEKLDMKFKYNEKEEETEINVVNGISNVILTDDEELVNVLFVKNIKPKKKKYAKAAEPDFDL